MPSEIYKDAKTATEYSHKSISSRLLEGARNLCHIGHTATMAILGLYCILVE